MSGTICDLLCNSRSCIRTMPRCQNRPKEPACEECGKYRNHNNTRESSSKVCLECALHVQVREIAEEHYTLVVQNEKPEYLTPDLISDEAMITVLLMTTGDL